jgi:hypothetical protein
MTGAGSSARPWSGVRVALLCASLTAATAASPAPVFAQNSQKEAANRFNKGYELFKEGDFQAALIEFKRAYELAPNFRVLYNIGQVQFQLQDYAGALASLEQYLDEGGKQVPAARRKEVEKDIEKLRVRVSRVEITTNVPGATITIDDIEIGTAPLDEPVLVSAGRRTIAATKDGRMPARKVIDVAGNDALSVRLELPELASGSPPVVYVEDEEPTDTVEPPPDEITTDEPAPDLPWAWWIGTGVLGTASAIFGALALDSASDLESMREQSPATAGDLDSAKDRTTAFSVTTDVLLVGTAIVGGISIYLTIDAVTSSGDEEDVSIRARVVPPLPFASADGGTTLSTPGVAIDGTF